MAGKSKLSKSTAIPYPVAQTVIERDNGQCIICGRNDIQIAHYISRARLGLGIPENLVCLCLYHHSQYDNGKYHREIKKEIEDYLRQHYPDWDGIQKTYSKWR